ncbi:YceI family protein [Corynebacterium sp. 35RC1]|nr:YceI family protein [Corynebacterium sp. 35RC1]
MQKKTILIVAAIVAVALLAFAVPRFYAARESSDVAAPTVSAAPADVTNAPITGSWAVAEGSTAGYRLDEVLNGADVTVVGRTEEVSGSAQVEGQELVAAEIQVDLASVATDSERRDNYFRTQAIDTSVHPSATFVLTQPVTLGESWPQQVSLTGDMQINGVTQQVVLDAEVTQVSGQLQVAGAVPVTWADFEVQAPNLGFVSVEDQGSVEFLVVLERA